MNSYYRNKRMGQALKAFAEELVRWRTRRGLSKKHLASQLGFDPSYVSHIEGGRHPPSGNFAKRAEAVLQAEGEIWSRYVLYDELRRGEHTYHIQDSSPRQWLPPGTVLVVEKENATLAYLNGSYQCTIRRQVYNVGDGPVTQYPVTISVDRYPGNPLWSNRYYRRHPLSLDELHFTASIECAYSEPMDWRVVEDRDAYKEILVCFMGDGSEFPLYPGRRATIIYSYKVSDNKWGQWFEREIRMPTEALEVRLVFPPELKPTVWGTHISLMSDQPFQTPIQERTEKSSVTFTWSTSNPPLQTRYRFHWRFKSSARPPVEQNPNLFRIRSTRAS